MSAIPPHSILVARSRGDLLLEALLGSIRQNGKAISQPRPIRLPAVAMALVEKLMRDNPTIGNKDSFRKIARNWLNNPLRGDLISEKPINLPWSRATTRRIKKFLKLFPSGDQEFLEAVETRRWRQGDRTVAAGVSYAGGSYKEHEGGSYIPYAFYDVLRFSMAAVFPLDSKSHFLRHLGVEKGDRLLLSYTRENSIKKVSGHLRFRTEGKVYVASAEGSSELKVKCVDDWDGSGLQTPSINFKEVRPLCESAGPCQQENPYEEERYQKEWREFEKMSWVATLPQMWIRDQIDPLFEGILQVR